MWVWDGAVWVWGEEDDDDDDVAGGSWEPCLGDGGDGGAVWVRVWVLW